MAEAYDYIYTVCTFLGFLMVVIPLPWHLQGLSIAVLTGVPFLTTYDTAWNASTCLFMFWTSLCCLNYSINSIVWRNDYVNRAPVWCDICEF
jgi:pheromone a factor receptor